MDISKTAKSAMFSPDIELLSMRTLFKKHPHSAANDARSWRRRWSPSQRESQQCPLDLGSTFCGTGKNAYGTA